jgi:transposase
MPGSYSLDLRRRVIAACDKGGLSRREIAELYHVGESTIYEWLQRRRTTQSLAPLPHTGGRASAVDGTVLSELVEAENDRTLAEYAARYAEQAGRLYSVSHLCRKLKSLRLRRKKNPYEPASNSDRTSWLSARRSRLRSSRSRRKTWSSSTRAASPRRWCGVSRVRQAAAAPSAGRPPDDTRSWTLVGAIALSGLKALMTIPAATDEAVVLAFVEQVLVPELRAGQVVVFDNLSAHKRPAITAAIEKAGCRVILLPPYTSEWNPIEPRWSKMKELLRSRAARTLETLEGAVLDAMDGVSSKDAHGWFRHRGYNVAPD